MVMMRGAKFDLWAHMAGLSPKPEASVTTHQDSSGARVWYIGGGVAERATDSNPDQTIFETKTTLKKFIPDIDFKDTQWAVYGINRIEGLTKNGQMPDQPVFDVHGKNVYAWPTKMTFAPLLADRLLAHVRNEMKIVPHYSLQIAGSVFPDFALSPWEGVSWKK